MDIDTARGVAARIWCDPDYEHVIMNPDLAEKIAVILMDEANHQAAQQKMHPTAYGVRKNMTPGILILCSSSKSPAQTAAGNLSRWKAPCKDWSLMREINIISVSSKMADAIREWNRAKQERESWVPVVGQVPPVGILGSAKKANAMLAEALNEYEAFQQSVHWTFAICAPEYHASLDEAGDRFCRMCGQPLSQ